MVPLGVLFLLEHLTIVCYELDSCHSAVHTISHYAIHNIVNDMYVHSFWRGGGMVILNGTEIEYCFELFGLLNEDSENKANTMNRNVYNRNFIYLCFY